MSYDICVFNIKKAPRKKSEFNQWFAKVTEWSDNSTSYDDIFVSSEDLRQWYKSMLLSFPAMNGRDAESSAKAYAEANNIDLDSAMDNAADYTIDKDLIYVSFGYSQAEDAYNKAFSKAKELGLGFYDPQEDQALFCGEDVCDSIASEAKPQKTTQDNGFTRFFRRLFRK